MTYEVRHKKNTWVVTNDLFILICYGVAYIGCLKRNLLINEAMLVIEKNFRLVTHLGFLGGTLALFCKYSYFFFLLHPFDVPSLYLDQLSVYLVGHKKYSMKTLRLTCDILWW